MTLIKIQKDEYIKLKDEVEKLRIKFKSMQGVSMVFRQKIALIVREVSHQHCEEIESDSALIQRLYAKAFRELSAIDLELSYVQTHDSTTEISQSQRRITGINYSASSHNADRQYNSKEYDTSPPTYEEIADEIEKLYSDRMGSNEKEKQQIKLSQRVNKWLADDKSKQGVKSAHNLCVIIQEKNELKTQERQLKCKLQTLEEKHRDLKDKYEKLTNMLQSQQIPTNSNSTNTHQVVYEQRIALLQDELQEAKDEVVHCSSCGKRQQKGVTLRRSNKGSLNEEIAFVIKRSEESFAEMQNNIDSLLDRVQLQQREIEKKDAKNYELSSQQQKLTKCLLDKDKEVKEHISRYEALQRDHDVLKEVYQNTSDQRAMDAAKTDLANSVKEYEELLSQRDILINTLRMELQKVNHLNNQKDINIEVLEKQVQSLKARLDAVELEKLQMDCHQQSYKDISGSIGVVLDEMLGLHTNDGIALQLAGLNNSMTNIEGINEQIRLKDDQLAVVQNELQKLQSNHKELQTALSSISSLFTLMPGSVEDLELLLIKHSVYERELCKAAAREGGIQYIPDIAEIEGIIDVRVLEAKHRRKSALVLGDCQQRKMKQQLKNFQQCGYDFQPVPNNIADISHIDLKEMNGDFDDMQDNIDAAIDVPPPPSLVGIKEAFLGEYLSSKTSIPQPLLSHLYDDIKIAFDLFCTINYTEIDGDNCNNDTVRTLQGDNIGLCLQALGVDVAEGMKALQRAMGYTNLGSITSVTLEQMILALQRNF